jgi:hypothetical protein
MKSERARYRSVDYTESSFREKLLEHVFVSELLQEGWLNRHQTVEVLRSEVDNSGYDLVLECGDVTRHVQLKSSRADSRTARQTVNIKLARKPSGCVVWLLYKEDTTSGRVKLDYLFFGGGPDEPLPSLGSFKVGRHTKADATGHKSERPGTRVIPKQRFVALCGIKELMDVLFGSTDR